MILQLGACLERMAQMELLVNSTKYLWRNNIKLTQLKLQKIKEEDSFFIPFYEAITQTSNLDKKKLQFYYKNKNRGNTSLNI
jgi:hypothetical protein